VARLPASSGGSNILRRPTPQEARRRVALFQFLGEVISELKKVTWPTRQETMRLTMLVIAISVAIGAVLGLLDIIFSQLLNLFI
jgi:preprotein translocase subunit SecE